MQLREHQVEAQSRIRTWVGFPARSPVPAQGARATLVSATGSGKTITAAMAALDLFRDGRILVMVPTLDLLVQTAQAWRQVGHRGPMVGVCSLEGDEVLEQLGVWATTNPVRLALWVGVGPVVVLATYASLVDRDDIDDPSGLGRVRGPLEAALAGGKRLYGQRMDGFDLAVVDETHGTAGDLGQAWAAIHDNTRIPRMHRALAILVRLAAAANTPRVTEPPAAASVAAAGLPPGNGAEGVAEVLHIALRLFRNLVGQDYAGTELESSREVLGAALPQVVRRDYTQRLESFAAQHQERLEQRDGDPIDRESRRDTRSRCAVTSTVSPGSWRAWHASSCLWHCPSSAPPTVRRRRARTGITGVPPSAWHGPAARHAPAPRNDACPGRTGV